MKTLASILLLTTLASGAVLAQSTPPAPLPPAPTGPTIVQCNQPWKEGMGWTQEQFAKACQDLRDRNKP